MMVATIPEIVETVKRVILRKMTPISILLIGSFGRGEESVYTEGDRKKLLRDMDILVVVKRRVSADKMLSINKEANAAIGLSYDPDSYLYKHFVVTILQMPLEELVFWNDIKAYDIKHACRLVWGKDIRESMAIDDPLDLSPFSAVRVLLNKYVGLSSLSPLSYFHGSWDPESERVALMECAKTYVEIGTAACILNGSYAPSYRERMNIVARKVRWLPEQLKKKIIRFTELKLNPSQYDDAFSLNLRELWFETRNDLNMMFLWGCRNIYNISWNGDWVTYVDAWIPQMRRQALTLYFRFYLERKIGMRFPFFFYLLNYLYEKMLCYRVAKELRFRLRALSALQTNPLFELYGSAIVLTNSLNPDLTVNHEYVYACLERLARLALIDGRSVASIIRRLDGNSLYLYCADLLSKDVDTIRRAFY